MINFRNPVLVISVLLLISLCNVRAQNDQFVLEGHNAIDGSICDERLQEFNSLKYLYRTGVYTTALEFNNQSAFRIDSLYYNQYDNIKKLEIAYREIISYSDSNNSFTILKQKYLGQWEDNYLSTFTYDDNGNILTELYEEWDKNASSWVKINRKTATYNENEIRISYLSENWDAGSEVWEAYSRYTYTYDEHHNQLTQLLEKWAVSSASWSESNLFTNTYDENGNVLSTMYENIANTWADDQLVTNTYDSVGNQTSSLRSLRKPNTTEWINDTRYFYTYDTLGNILIDQTERWNIYIDEWYRAERTVYTYDSIGNLVERVYEVPIPNTDLFRASSYHFYYSYNEKNERIHEYIEKWDIQDSIWFEYAKADYEYDPHGNISYFKKITWSNTVSSPGYWRAGNESFSFEFRGYPITFICSELRVYFTETELPSNENEMLSFVLEGLDPAVSATITDTLVNAVVPANTDLTSLVPNIEISDLASVDPASGIAQDFTSPITYTVTAENGEEQIYFVKVELSTDREELEVDHVFNMYPNPAMEHIYFNEAQSVIIYDVTGSVVKLKERTKDINISDLKAGVYFVKNERDEIRKLVVKK